MTTTITTKQALWKEILQDPLNIDAWHMYADVLVQLNEDPMTAELIYNDIESKSYQFSSEMIPYVERRSIAGYIVQMRMRLSYFLMSYYGENGDLFNLLFKRHPTCKFVRIYNDAERFLFEFGRARFIVDDWSYDRPLHGLLGDSTPNMILKHLLAEQFPAIRWDVV